MNDRNCASADGGGGDGGGEDAGGGDGGGDFGGDGGASYQVRIVVVL